VGCCVAWPKSYRVDAEPQVRASGWNATQGDDTVLLRLTIS
jgi:hypothetical protein